MTTAKLFEKHRAGEIGRDRFLYEVRRDSNLPWITNLTSYDDAVKILKNKGIIREAEGYTQSLTQRGMGTPEYPGTAYEMRRTQKPKDPVLSDLLANLEYTKSYEEAIEYTAKENGIDEEELKRLYPKDEIDTEGYESINEAHELSVDQIIDRLNPYHFKRAIEFEVKKLKITVDQPTHDKIKAKVAKKMMKDPLAYESSMLANAKQIKKQDAKQEMEEVKKENFVDKENEMKKAKGYEVKKNTGTTKKENRKGNPKGVKEMKGSKKAPKGVEKMKESGKESILEAMIDFFKKKDSINENSVIPTERADYSKGQQIETPKGKGIVVEKHGSIVEVDMEDGSKETFTLNVLDNHNAKNRFDDQPRPEDRAKDAEKAERDAMWKDFDNLKGASPETGVQRGPSIGQELNYKPEDIHSLLKKLKKITEKLKLKNELKAVVSTKTNQPLPGAVFGNSGVAQKYINNLDPSARSQVKQKDL